MEMNPYGQALSGDGTTIEIGFLATKNSHGLADALVKVTGRAAFSAGIDGKTRLYRVTGSGSTQTMTYTRGGQTSQLMRTTDGWQSASLFLDGQTLHLKQDKGLVHEVRPLHLLTAYQQSFESVPGRLTIERGIAPMQEQLKATGWPGSVAVNWSGLNEDPTARQIVHASLQALPSVIKSINSDNIGREALAQFKTLAIEVVADTSFEAKPDGERLVLRLGAGAGADDIEQGLTTIMQNAL